MTYNATVRKHSIGFSGTPPHRYAGVFIRAAQWLNERGSSQLNYTKGKIIREKQSGPTIDTPTYVLNFADTFP